MEPPEHGARCERHILPDGRREEPPGFCRLPVLTEHLHHSRRQHQLADGGLGLGDAHVNLSVCLIDLFGYGQGSGVQIQVGPLQGQQLSPAKAGGQVQQEQFEVAVRLGLDEKPLELLAGQHLHLPTPLGRDLAAHRRVGPDQVLLHRLIQSRPAFGVSHPHHAVGETLSMLFCADQPSPPFSGGRRTAGGLSGSVGTAESCPDTG